jgi:dihydroorotase
MKQMDSILITAGRIIDPASQLDAVGDVLIVNDTIKAIETSPGKLSPNDAARCIDAEGCIVTPGLIDIHVHLREPDETGQHEETIATGSAAAIAGGFTTVCCMPNTRPALDDPNVIQRVQHQATKANQARVFAVGCGTMGRKGTQPAPIAALADAGAIAISDDGDVIADAAMMVEVLRQCAAADRCFMQHCQELTLTRGASMNAGPVAQRLGQIGWPAVAEELIIERDIRLNRDIGCHYHAQHLSSGESAAIIRRAQAEGQPITGEVSPHHLLLTDESCETYGTMAKMNPPLRTQRDIDQLKQAVAEGIITILGTDHAPHPLATKQVDLAKASFGIVGLECALPLYVKALIDDGVVDWPTMVRMMTIAPANLVGLDRRGLGMLRVGGPADVTILDPNMAWTINSADFASQGRNCPFDGWDVRTRAVAVLVNGQIKLQRSPERVSSPAKR